MLRAFLLAVHQLSDPAVQRLVVRCVLLALATFVGLAVLVGLGIAALDVTGIAWLDTTLAFAGSGLSIVLAWLLFPASVVVTLSMFAEDVADAVERRHYPDLPPPPGIPLTDSIAGSVRFAALALALNICALPLYLLPVANLVIFLGLNGYLVGREYFDLVAQRRLPIAQVRALRRAVIGRVWLAGAACALMLMVPLANLLAPVLATAFMLHLFERWRRRVPVGVGEIASR